MPYEKGFALLNELQRRVGVEAFHAFAKDYIKEFRCVAGDKRGGGGGRGGGSIYSVVATQDVVVVVH